MSKRRAGTGGVTPPPPDLATARKAVLQVYSDAIRRGITTGPEASVDVQDTLDALGLTALVQPAESQPQPQPVVTSAPTPRATTPPGPLPDVLTPRHAAAVARAAHRAKQPVPARAARVLNHQRRATRTEATR